VDAAEEKPPKPVKEDAKDPAIRVVDRRWWARGDAQQADESGVRKPTYIEELEQRLADATAQLQNVMAEHRRSLEEFDQVKARLRRDVGRDVERAKRAVVGDLLEVLDNLDRAHSAAAATGRTSSDEFDALLRGVGLVRDQFLGKLEALGVVRMAALDQPFDAHKHEAVSTAPVDDAARDGIVVAVVRQGYAIGDDVVRPAAVVVGKHV
jgi:molecular chaperone GrpE